MDMSLTLEQLMDAFERYNLAIWPMQVLAYVMGIGTLFLAIKNLPSSNKIITGILSFLWLWTAIGFFFLYFGPVYRPAYIFGGFFIIQGIVFLATTLKPRFSFSYKGDAYSHVGIFLIAYAMVGYPVVGYFLGHWYPQSPPFGLTPCPVTVFTFGMLLLTDKKVPRSILIIPALWALGGIMPVSVGILEDTGLIVAGVLGTAMILYRNKKIQD